MSNSSREDLIQYCYRKLGAPLVEINITEEQADDVIDEAVAYFRDYYFDGIEKVYLKHQITATDIENRYITLPDLIFGVNRVFPITGYSVGNGDSKIFDPEYQMRMNDLRDLTSISLIYYAVTQTHLALIDNLLNTQKQFRWNKLTNKLYIDQNWDSKAPEGMYILIDCYRALDPADAPKFWNDNSLKHYATALMKTQWGANIKKFGGITLPGGITLDGQSLYEEGKQEASDIEDSIMNKSAPLEFIMG
jgi:hypothetical protein